MSFKIKRIRPPNKPDEDEDNNQKSRVRVNVHITQGKCQTDKSIRKKCHVVRRQNYKCLTSEISPSSAEGGNTLKKDEPIYRKYGRNGESKNISPSEVVDVKHRSPPRPPRQVVLKNASSKSSNRVRSRPLDVASQVENGALLFAGRTPKYSLQPSPPPSSPIPPAPLPRQVENGGKKVVREDEEGTEGVEKDRHKYDSGMTKDYYSLYYPSRSVSPSTQTERSNIESDYEMMQVPENVHDWSLDDDDMLSQEETDIQQGFSSLTNDRQGEDRISELDKIHSSNINSSAAIESRPWFTESRGLTDEMLTFVESLNNMIPHEYSNLFKLKTDDSRWAYLRKLASNMEERDREWEKWRKESEEESGRERKRPREIESESDVSVKRLRNENLSMPILSEVEMETNDDAQGQIDNGSVSSEIEQLTSPNLSQNQMDEEIQPLAQRAEVSPERVDINNVVRQQQQHSPSPSSNLPQEIDSLSIPLPPSSSSSPIPPASETPMPERTDINVPLNENEGDNVNPPSSSPTSSLPIPKAKSRAGTKFLNSLRDLIRRRRARKVKKVERNEMRQLALDELNQIDNVGVADLVEMPSNYDFDYEDIDFNLKRKKPKKRKRALSLSNLPSQINRRSSRYGTIQPPRKIFKNRGVKRKNVNSGKIAKRK